MDTSRHAEDTQLSPVLKRDPLVVVHEQDLGVPSYAAFFFHLSHILIILMRSFILIRFLI